MFIFVQCLLISLLLLLLALRPSLKRSLIHKHIFGSSINTCLLVVNYFMVCLYCSLFIFCFLLCFVWIIYPLSWNITFLGMQLRVLFFFFFEYVIDSIKQFMNQSASHLASKEMLPTYCFFFLNFPQFLEDNILLDIGFHCCFEKYAVSLIF